MENFDDYFDFLEFQYREEERVPKRYIRSEETPLNFYREDEFRRRFRFSKEIVLNRILPLINEKLQTFNNRGLPISPLVKLLICLRFYATGSFQNVSGDLHYVSQGSVSLIVQKVSVLLAEQLRHFIKFPETEQKQRENILLFHHIANFPSVAGCVDCTHIPIVNPGGENGEVFRNRKGYFSLNVQVVAGPHLEILDIVVRHPGSTHDSVIFDRSAVRVRFEQGEVRGLLLGDNGYACRPYLVTPLLHTSNQQEDNYNRCHKKKQTRNLVERVFGVCKRFPCLHRTLGTKLQTTCAIICATAVLYNIGVQYNDEFHSEESDELEMDNSNDSHIRNNELGLAFRRQFIITHF